MVTKIKQLIVTSLLITSSISTLNNEPRIDIGCFKVSPSDIVNVVTYAGWVADEPGRINRGHITSKIKDIEDKQLALGRKKDAGSIGNAEYEQQSKSLEQESAQCRKELDRFDERSQKVGDNVQNLVGKSWEAVLSNYQDEAQRKTKIAQAAAVQGVANEGAMERMKLLLQKDNLVKTGLFLTGAAVGISGGYYLSKLFYAYLKARMSEPELVQEVSERSVFEKIRQFFFGKQDHSDVLKEIIFEPEVEKELHKLAHGIKSIAEHRLPFRNLLLYGPPGTGKTAFARKLAKYSGLEWKRFSGASLTKFDAGKDVQKLDELFSWIKQSDNPKIIFIDEADSFLAKKETLDQRGKNLLNAFLSQTGTDDGISYKVMFIFATNHPDVFEPAVLSRIHKQVAILAPNKNERIKILNLYLDKLTKGSDNTPALWTLASDIDNAFIDEVATKTDGFVGRDLEALCIDLPFEAVENDTTVITRDMFITVLQAKINQDRNKVDFIQAEQGLSHVGPMINKDDLNLRKESISRK